MNTNDPYFEWECHGCTAKLRVRIERDWLVDLIYPLSVQCPVCMTYQVPPFQDGGPHYGLQFDDGSGWKDERDASTDSVLPDVSYPVPPRVVIIDVATDRPEEPLVKPWERKTVELEELLVKSWERKTVELTEKWVVFGRRAPPYTDVHLPSRIVSNFAIQWNAKHNCHEIQDFGRSYQPSLSLNGEPLKRAECKPLSLGDVITIGPFIIEYTAPLEEQTEA